MPVKLFSHRICEIDWEDLALQGSFTFSFGLSQSNSQENWDEISVISSENQLVRFPNLVLTVISCSTPFTVIVMFWVLIINLILLLPIGGRASAGNVFLTGKDLKKRCNFWDAYKSYTWYSIVVQTRKKKIGLKNSYFFNGENSCFVDWSEFFQSLGEVSVWRFLVLQFCWNLRNWIPKLIWSRMNCLCIFFLEYASLSQLHDCIEWYHQQLLNF